MNDPDSTAIQALRARALRVPRYTSYPTALQFRADFDPATFFAEIDRTNDEPVPPPLAFYAHLPFCAAACFYCGCNRLISRHPVTHAAYLQSLIREIEQIGQSLAPDRELLQIHFGGGTPNLLAPRQIGHVLAAMTRSVQRRHDCEIALEIDPRQVSPDDIAAWARMGANRLSIGVQDIDPAVQSAINRVQPCKLVEEVTTGARRAGFRSINYDLILGLPRQNTATMATTLSWVLRQRPDRIALYQYAHMPTRFPAQRAISEPELPQVPDRYALQQQCSEALLAADYVAIGMDHFALPHDPLAQAQREGRLRRNFQGYTVLDECDLIGFGLSAISHVGDVMTQNTTDLGDYHAQIGRHTTPISRGLRLSAEDRLRAALIEELMCTRGLDTKRFASREGINFAAHFSDALQRLEDLDPGQALLDRRQPLWRASQLGSELLRLLANCFDAYTPTAASGDGPAIEATRLPASSSHTGKP